MLLPENSNTYQGHSDYYISGYHPYPFFSRLSKLCKRFVVLAADWLIFFADFFRIIAGRPFFEPESLDLGLLLIKLLLEPFDQLFLFGETLEIKVHACPKQIAENQENDDDGKNHAPLFLGG